MIDHTALDQLFYEARTHKKWLNMPVSDELLDKAWELARMGPTSGNSSPVRIVFVRSAEAKERLRPLLDRGNIEQTMAAPATAIIGHDMAFYEKLPKLHPHGDARSWFVGNPALIEATAFRNGSLQGAYLIMACRALGLDCGPMSGFDAAQAEAEFFPEKGVTVNFLCNIGYGDKKDLHPRAPRLEFDEACEIV